MAQVKERGGGGKERKEPLADKPLPWVPETLLARFPLHARKTSGTQGNKPRDFENHPLGPDDVCSWPVMPKFAHRHLMVSSAVIIDR